MKLSYVTMLFGTAAAASAMSPLDCCRALAESEVASQIVYPGQELYNSSVSSYFSLNAQLSPLCIVQPSTAKDVSTAVSALVADDLKEPCKFAVRSGGHTAWAGAANIENGVTIDLSLLNTVVYDEEHSTASIGAGARWLSVYDALANYGVTVPGSRGGSIGVGGLTLGGGISFFTARYGFVCDNVVDFEVVLASGEIVNANSKENADLWLALKGGSSNLGIVTKVVLYTFPFEKLWGGVVAYPGNAIPDQILAFVNFNDKIKEDPCASVITYWLSTSAMPDIITANAHAYTKPEANPSILGEFLSIPGNISDSMRVTDLQDIVTEIEAPSGGYTGFWTITFSNDARILEKAVELHNTLADELKEVTSEWAMGSIIQPIPTLFSEHSLKRGGNVLGLDRAAENLILFLVGITWDKPEEEPIFRATGEKMIEQLAAYAKSIDGLNEFIYLNYAHSTQNPLAGYGAENLQKLKRTSEKYDPKGIFQTAAPGGFKIVNAEGERSGV